MCRILRKQIAHGLHSHGSFLNNELLASNSGATQWATPCQIVCNGPYNSVNSIDPATKIIASAFPFMSPGADVICAGNSVIAASLDGQGTRLRNFAGLTSLSDQTGLDVDKSSFGGTFISYNRQEGKNIHIYFANYKSGAYPILLTEAIRSARCFEHIVSWSEELPNKQIVPKAYNISNNHVYQIAPIDINVYQTIVFVWKGIEWILYSDQDGHGRMHPINAKSPLYHFDMECYGLDMEIQDDGRLMIAWGTNPGETNVTSEFLS